MSNFGDGSAKSGSSWGQFESFRTGGSFNAANAGAMDDDDEDSRLFEVGVSTPSQQGEGEGNKLHVSPAMDLDSPMAMDEGDDVGEAGAQSTHSSNSSNMTELEHACMKCKAENTALVFSYPCGCYAVCRKCAMKLATGGKCKICKAFYSSFTSTRTANRGKGSDSDSDSDAGGKG